MSQQETRQQYIYRDQLPPLREATYQINEGRPLGRQLRDEVIVAFTFDTGVRNDELVDIRPDGMIRLEQEELFLPADVQKDYPNENSPTDATLVLNRSDVGLVRLLRTYLNSEWYQRQDTEYLLPSRQSDQVSKETVWNVIERLSIEAGVRPYRTDGERGNPSELSCHDLRHSVANWMLQDGHRLVDVRNRLRYSSILVTE
jgi:integrase/recombinase XerC/integrase/recombinase XerD